MQHIDQKIFLQQKLSPQQILFSTLLQMPVMALEQKIKAELEMNPLLEEDIDQDEEQELEEEQEKDDEIDKQQEEAEKDSENEEDDEIDWDEILNDEDNYEYNPEKNRVEIHMPDPAIITLTDHLISQLQLQQLTPEEIEIGKYIIGNINEDGYLNIPVEEIAAQLQKSPELVEKVLKLIQRFDPVGIGARNLQECLLVQLQEKTEENKIAITIIKDYFDDFKNKRFEKICRALGLSLEKIKSLTDFISKLNIKPGEGYIVAAENYVIPDVTVEQVKNEFIITMNDWNIPPLRITRAYQKLINDSEGTSEETKRWIKQKIEAARWVINSLLQRKDTIQRVTREIVNRQREFFENGKGHIKPLILKDVADVVGLDISTVSRVTNGKYMQTEYGVFELKYFFSEKMTTAAGEQVSTLSIKDKIEEIIDSEDPKKPLTDDEIVGFLSGKGIPIARRTVAKYREQLRIPVARMRREI